MNKSAGVVLAIIVLLGIGGYLIYTNKDTAPPPPVTPPTPPGQSPPPPPQVVQPGPPIAITNPSVAPTDTTAVVTGSVIPNGAFASYWYEYGLTASLGSKTPNQNVGSGYAVIPAPVYITNLAANRTYYFRLVAENAYGRVAGAQYTFQTTQGTPPPVGSAPFAKTFAASGVTRTTANLNGGVDPNQASTQHWFEYGKTASLGNTTAFVSVGSGNAEVPASISLSDLEPQTTYYFRLNAQNQFGTVNGAILNFKTLGPASATAPSVTTLAATDVSKTNAKLHGTVDPNGAETTYWFEYSTDSLLGSVLLKTTTKRSVGGSSNQISVEANVTGLTSTTTYYFRLVAQNSAGLVRGDRLTFKTK